jgi:hypothetical protein
MALLRRRTLVAPRIRTATADRCVTDELRRLGADAVLPLNGSAVGSSRVTMRSRVVPAKPTARTSEA